MHEPSHTTCVQMDNIVPRHSTFIDIQICPLERKLVSEAVWKGDLDALKGRLDKKILYSCSVHFSSHFKTTLHTASYLP